MAYSTLNTAGETYVPKNVVEALGLRPGVRLWWSVSPDGKVVVQRSTPAPSRQRPVPASLGPECAGADCESTEFLSTSARTSMSAAGDRVSSLLMTGDFLRELLSADHTPGVPDEVRLRARRLLQDFPSAKELGLLVGSSPSAGERSVTVQD